jgi:hypothetical protein
MKGNIIETIRILVIYQMFNLVKYTYFIRQHCYDKVII